NRVCILWTALHPDPRRRRSRSIADRTCSSMLVIPALDLRHGHCVRVHRGRYEDESVYFADPVRMAKLWRVMNAKTVHIVDHDTPQQDEEGAAATRAEIVRIAAALDIPVQTSGRFETMADVEAML